MGIPQNLRQHITRSDGHGIVGKHYVDRGLLLSPFFAQGGDSKWLTVRTTIANSDRARYSLTCTGVRDGVGAGADFE